LQRKTTMSWDTLVMCVISWSHQAGRNSAIRCSLAKTATGMTTII